MGQPAGAGCGFVSVLGVPPSLRKKGPRERGSCLASVSTFPRAQYRISNSEPPAVIQLVQSKRRPFRGMDVESLLRNYNDSEVAVSLLNVGFISLSLGCIRLDHLVANRKSAETHL